MRLPALCLVLIATPGLAAEDRPSAFVEANILSIFYHELGHAVIDIEGIPIFGQEEDAADVFSIFLIDALYEPEASEGLAYDAALGFWGEAETRAHLAEEIAWWDVHGPDEQRFYNTVCLYYGADPEGRQGFADDLDLPEDRAAYCAEEYDQAADSWGAVLDQMIARGPGDSLSLEGDAGPIAQVLRSEIEALNEELSLEDSLPVAIESCGEANAFYDPEARRITMCTEFIDHLEEMEARL